MDELLIESLGAGERVLLVHGSLTSGPTAWRTQHSLAQRWRLDVLTRRRYWPQADDGRDIDFVREAEDVASLLTEPAHLVGHSYGAVIALLAAAAVPDAVRSLVVSEPPMFALPSAAAEARLMQQDLERLFGDGPSDAGAFLAAFLGRLGAARSATQPLTPELAHNVPLLRRERAPWDARPDFDALRAAPFETLVISGGHDPAFDAVCDTLAQLTGATRAAAAGAGHAVPFTGAPYNQLLENWWTRARNR
jgi:pimeloyl-ACP methyl ester carboxylesterase